MFDISRLDLMWVSFVSLGSMAAAALLIVVARTYVTNRFVSIIIAIIAWILLIFAGLLMIPVLGGSNHA